jgi:hypothetical protein
MEVADGTKLFEVGATEIAEIETFSLTNTSEVDNSEIVGIAEGIEVEVAAFAIMYVKETAELEAADVTKLDVIEKAQVVVAK